MVEDDQSIEVFDMNKASKAQGTIYTPKWLIKQCGHTFGFGGKIAIFSKGKTIDIIPNVGFNASLLQAFDQFNKDYQEKDIETSIQANIQK